jgi:hypothetical protein
MHSFQWLSIVLCPFMWNKQNHSCMHTTSNFCTKLNFLNPEHEGSRFLRNASNTAHCHKGQSWKTWSTLNHYIIYTSKNYIQLHILHYIYYNKSFYMTYEVISYHIILMIRYEITMISAHYSRWIHQCVLNSSKSILFWYHKNDQWKHHRISAGMSAKNCQLEGNTW